MASHDPNASTSQEPGPERSSPTVNGWLVLLLLGLVGILFYRMLDRSSPLLHDPNAVPRAVTPRGDLADDEKSTIELFERVSPAVVHITNLRVQSDSFRLNMFEIPQGTGSGFIWDTDGHIVTNLHVIKDAQAARVMLADHSNWNARLVGLEPDKDLAVLKIDAPKSRLVPILIGTSSDLKVGQKVFAIGNPFGLDQTLTTGVISGVGREIPSVTDRPILNVIQTDAAINPGNSGGPLLDSAGRLIGVNTAIAPPAEAYAGGIGFAVPVDTVNRIVPDLIRDGKVEHPGIGVYLLDDAITRAIGLRGVLIREVPPGSAAEKIGLQPTRRTRRGEIVLGDLIVGVDGQPVQDTNDLLKLLDSRKVGQTILLTVIRGNKKIELPVTLQTLSDITP